MGLSHSLPSIDIDSPRGNSKMNTYAFDIGQFDPFNRLVSVHLNYSKLFGLIQRNTITKILIELMK
jgi:hypothetical protein